MALSSRNDCDAQDGAVFGALDATFCERDTGQRATRHARAFEDKESHRWLAATERAGQITGAARLTMVAREADIYDLFARRPEHVDMIVRANHNRTLDGGDKMIGSLPCQDWARRDPGAGLPTLSIRFGQMTIKPPKRLEKTTPASIILTYIDLREETPPDGIKPVHWRLLTTYDVTDVIGALDVAERYAKRWKIEELFRTMKRKGFNIEALRIKDTAPRNRLILACMIAATIVMQMVAEREGVRLRPLTDAFDVDDQPLLETLSATLEGKTDRQRNPHPKGSLAFATWVCARLGGWTGYYGKPGPIVILSGWTDFQSIKHGAQLARNMGQKINQNV
ncbi:transposase [Marivita sp.]|uniref:transposase n=1 Tax=Marivita sp. TaxID=2003365 RepID=UPI003B596842